jgi:hypothetical protein
VQNTCYTMQTLAALCRTLATLCKHLLHCANTCYTVQTLAAPCRTLAALVQTLAALCTTLAALVQTFRSHGYLTDMDHILNALLSCALLVLLDSDQCCKCSTSTDTNHTTLRPFGVILYKAVATSGRIRYAILSVELLTKGHYEHHK